MSRSLDPGTLGKDSSFIISRDRGGGCGGDGDDKDDSTDSG
jgi:hypothetical protein